MKKNFSIFLNVVLIAAIGVGGWFIYKDQLYDRVIQVIKPCSKPITYSFGSIDPRFGVTDAQFAEDVIHAKSLWEQAAGKPLFTESSSGTLVIDMVYDYRQQATAQLQKLGFTITATQSSYDALNKKYTSYQAQYTADKDNLATEVTNYNTAQTAYNTEANYWNSAGGAPPTEYQKLNQEEATLKTEASQIQTDQTTVNQLAGTINALITVINNLASQLNNTATTYNNVGAQTGTEFEEGVYISGVAGQQIHIYQFNNQTELIRVLAHELGHALGFVHVTDPNAIMYRINQGTKIALTQADITQLDQVCDITPK